MFVGINLGINQLRSSVSFSPAVLFALGEPGVWFDPSDVANLNWRVNLLTWTEDFSNPIWQLGGGVVTKGTLSTDKPDGTTGTVSTLAFPAVPSNYAFVYQQAGSLIGMPITYSIWMRVASGTGTMYLNVEDTLVAPTGANAFGSPALTLTTTWQRFTLTGTRTSGTGNATAVIGFDGRVNAGQTNPAPLTVQVWGAQLELGSVATTYQPITDVNTEVIQRFPYATLYQDTAGTIPVTGPTNLAGAPSTVALMLDKSKGLVPGPDVVTNGDFSGGATGWLFEAGWAIASGVATGTATNGFLYQNTGSITQGKYYDFTFTVTGYAGGSIQPFVGSSPVFGTAASSSGTFTRRIFLSASSGQLGLKGTSFTGSIDNIIVRELPGNHATQITPAARPNYAIEPAGGRRNLLTFSEQFDNPIWAKTNATVTANASTAPDGSLTADRLAAVGAGNSFLAINPTVTLGQAYTATLYVKRSNADWISFSNQSYFAFFNLSGAGSVGTIDQGTGAIQSVGDGWFRITWAGSTAFSTALRVRAANANGSGNATGGEEYLIWGAQLELGSTATNYQKVTTQYDVTEAGKASMSYLYFNGINNSMATSTITPGIDKAQVFSGVRKNSDSGVGVLLETSPVVNNLGSLAIYASNNGANYAAIATGSLLAGVQASTYAAPVTNVVSALFDIAQTATLDEFRIRVDGATPPTVTVLAGPAGTGNFLAYPMYLGFRQSTASLYFNGHIYSLITRFGATLPDATITNTETWVSGKTGFYTPIITGVPTIGVS